MASLALARISRQPVLAFYRFARMADDIADAAGLCPEDKLRRLDRLEQALLDADPTEPVARELARVGTLHDVGPAQALDLLRAFRQDVVQPRYPEWEDLLAYCRLSANPVGRFLLRLHDEKASADASADALCTALQILNHLQDVLADRDALDRVYLPQSWLADIGGEAVFFDPAAGAARRAILDAVLERVDLLVAEAEALPARLANRRLAVQAAATLGCARALAAKLRRQDPVLRRVTLTRPELARCLGLGLLSAASGRAGRPDRAVVRSVVQRSGSSFRLGMASLGGERRRAMHALYAFCRLVDDAADSAAPPAARTGFLSAWQAELDRLDGSPSTPVARELAWACRRFELPRLELNRLVGGMLADAVARVRLTDHAALERYCRAVAGSVGLLSIRIFGAKGADAFALDLARALQLVNILRDVEEDAARDRVYLPLDLLAGHGIPDGPAATIVGHHHFAAAWTTLLHEAEQAFSAADGALRGLDRGRLRPALLMRATYRLKFEMLRRRGWQPGAPPPRVGPLARVQLASLLLRSPS